MPNDQNKYVTDPALPPVNDLSGWGVEVSGWNYSGLY